MQLRQEQKQTQRLQPQTITALEILQLDVCQLQSYIAAALLENPLLDSDAPPMLALREEAAEAEQADSAPPAYAQPVRAAQPQVSSDIPDERTAAYGEDLTTHLLFQLDALRVRPALRRRAALVIHALDENGYLRQSLPEALTEAERDEQLQAIALVQSLEPAGVCARDLSECLCLQLRARGQTGLAYRLAADFLAQLGKHQFGAIAAAVQVTEAQVRAAFAQIQSLSPYPCAAFSAAPAVCYVIADVLVRKANGRLSVELNHSYTPSLKLNTFYSRLERETSDAALHQYIAQKTAQAQWLMSCIAQRETTILRCAEEILKRQEPFFAGCAPLAPMTMQDIALALGLHVSTVSRALNGKYIQTPRGTLKISDLFSAQLGKDGVSAAMAQEALAALVGRENKRDPLSDMRLSQLLSAQGIPLARRTVAKYRELLRIPPAAQRRQT